MMLSPVFSVQSAENERYEVGVFPHLSKSHIEKTYNSIFNHVSRMTNKNIHFDADENIENFYEHLRNEYYDIVLIQPFEYVNLSKKFGYTPLATQEKTLRTLIVAKKDGPIQNTQNLLGRKILLPPPSTAISYLTKKHLHDFGFNLNEDLNIQYEKTHVACLFKLLLGFADACASFDSALAFFRQKMFIDFQVVTQSQEIPHALFAAHPRLSEAEREKITQALISWGNSNEGKEILKDKWLMPFRRISDKDYDIVREIKADVDSYL